MARELSKLGHDVTLLPAQHVKPFVRGNKNDYNDALAIAEASRFAQIRTVAVKTVEQQSIQGLHRLRRSSVKDRTALCNQVRGLLADVSCSFLRTACADFIKAQRSKVPFYLEAGYTKANLSLLKCNHCLAKMEETIYGLAQA